MDSKKILRILKIVMLVSLILFALVVTKYKTNPCQKCEFELDGQDFRFKGFMDIYSEKCFDTEPMLFEVPLEVG